MRMLLSVHVSIHVVKCIFLSVHRLFSICVYIDLTGCLPGRGGGSEPLHNGQILLAGFQFHAADQ